MKKNNWIKVLFSLCLCTFIGIVAKAQSVQITQSGSPVSGYYCMSAGNTGTSFSVEGVSLSTDPNVTATIESTTWTVFGGIQKLSESVSDISVASGTGTDYAGLYSKYAKGKIRAVCHVAYSYTYKTSDCGGTTRDATYTYYVDYTTELEIRKTFTIPDGSLTNPIVGPECVEAGKSVTYSVAPWVSLDDVSNVVFDTYTWNIPSSAKVNDLYYSSDKSSVTFTASATAGGQTITVDLGACNATGVAQSSFTMGKTPDDPILDGISWTDGLCLPLNAGATSITITNADPAVTYTWEKLDGWASSQVGNVLTFTPATDAREIRLKAVGACTTKTYDLQINRSFDTIVNKITNSTGSTCLTKNTQLKFYVENAADGMSMQWSVVDGAATGWSIVSGDETKAQPMINVGTGTGRISVVAGCGNAIEQVFSIKPDVPGTISGTTCLTKDSTSTQAYSVAAVANASSYSWSYPTGWTVSGSSDQTTINLIPDGIHVGDIKVKAIGCGESNWSTPLTTKFNPVKPTIVQDGCLDAGLAGVTYFKVTNHVDGQTYTWTIDAAFGTQDTTYTHPTDDPSRIKVITTGTVGTYSVTAVAKNDCNETGVSSDPLSVNVNKNDFPYTPIGSGNVGLGKYHYSFTDDIPDLTWYNSHTCQWIYNGVDKTDPDDYSSTVIGMPTGLLTTTTASFYATITNITTGCKTRKMATADGFKSANVTESIGEMTISPNPTDSYLQVTMPEEDPANIIIYNMAGSIVKQSSNMVAPIEINVSELSTGNYFLVANQNGYRYAKKFIKK